MELFREADAVINLCGATEPREEHERSRCLVYLETDPGVFQLELARKIPTAVAFAKSHKLFFTYCYNIGAPDCLLPTAGLTWHPTRPPVSLDEWHPGVGPAEPRSFTTVGTWQNNGSDMVIKGETYYWSKHVNFRKVLDVAARANQPIEIATNLTAGPDYDRALAGGFSITPAVPMSLDIDTYREYISRSRGEFTATKDIYVQAAHRMVQRSHGMLPGRGPSGGHAAHRIRKVHSDRRRPAGFRHRRRSGRGDR